MNTFFYQNIEDIFTQSRLSVYKKDGVDDVTCLARYLFNIEICKSLYPALHIFEIALRNSIDKTLSGYAKTQNWYDVLTIDNESKNKIEETKRKIKKHGKSVTHDRIISELTLGFWTSFLTTRYSQYAFQSVIIKKCFKNIPIQNKNIKSLQKIFEKMRLLRNRVSHYERLIHWKDLKDQHLQLLECIKWLNVESYNIVKEIDCFDAVYSAGIQPFKTLVQNNWNIT